VSVHPRLTFRKRILHQYMSPSYVLVHHHGELQVVHSVPDRPCSDRPAPKRAKSAFFDFSTSRILAASLPVNVIRHRWRRNLDPAPYMAPIPVFVSTHGETPGARGAADPSWPCRPGSARARTPLLSSSRTRSPA